jgi:hypothetical protein
MPSSIGASPKNLAVLGVLAVALGVTAWVNLRSDEPTASASTTPSVPQRVPELKKLPDPVPGSDTSGAGPMPAHRTQRDGGRNIEEFHPSLKPKDDLDVSKIDPTLHTELLDRVRQVGMEGGSSNLFEFSKAPEPPTPKVNITVGPVPPPVVAKPVVPDPPKPTGPPPPPPIPLKYFGYAGDGKPSPDGKLRGLFLEGDPNTGDYYVKGENELIKDRYKVIRIGIKAADLEDTTNNHQQTLPLVDEQSQ